MKKPLKVISVDGTRGAGKTSQINMLSRFFKTLNLNTLTIKGGISPETGLSALQTIDTFLLNNPNGIVILDGSIARAMVSELIQGKSNMAVADKYKLVMRDYEKLNKQYGIVGLLFVMDDVQEANNRIIKRGVLVGVDEAGMDNVEAEKDVISGMRTFNNHIVSKNIDFHTFNIEPGNTMNEIHREVVSYLTQKYDIPTPKKDENEW